MGRGKRERKEWRERDIGDMKWYEGEKHRKNMRKNKNKEEGLP
jgi:hypothetical protein